MLSRKVDTAQGRVAVRESPGNGMPVLLIHGNSSCRDVFEQQFEADFAKVYRVVAVDLLGHGQSDNAREPRQAYTVPGHAAVLIDVLQSLNIQRAALLGWSLGGHIGLEMIGQGLDAAGIMIVGTPPVKRGVLGMIRGFQTQLDLLIATRGLLRPQEIERFARVSVGEAFAPRFYDTIARTDVRARPILARGMMTGLGVDQRWVVENLPTPVAVVNGSHEPFARLDYLSSLGYQNLWDGRCHIIEGAGHAPFLEASEPFNRLFSSFLDDMSRHNAGSAEQRSAHRVA
jgi:pimeloyl-ACP methyl ester carboxylesterase